MFNFFLGGDIETQHFWKIKKHVPSKSPRLSPFLDLFLVVFFSPTQNWKNIHKSTCESSPNPYHPWDWYITYIWLIFMVNVGKLYHTWILWEIGVTIKNAWNHELVLLLLARIIRELSWFFPICNVWRCDLCRKFISPGVGIGQVSLNFHEQNWTLHFTSMWLQINAALGPSSRANMGPATITHASILLLEQNVAPGM